MNKRFDFNQLSESEIEAVLSQHKIIMSVAEVKALQNEILGREPTLSECILWSIQGSEHCSYKSSRAHLKTMNTDGDNVIIGAKEDAGIVSIATDSQGQRYGIAISHESHNHPSQIVPYEGAATGVGGNVRDVMCMGARVIAVADGLRFGEINHSTTQWIHEGVVAGIAGYANPLGVPSIAGDLYYNKGYNDNCLVTVVTLGAVAESEIIHSYAPKNAAGYDLILVGKPTDNSGFGGASFSSIELEEEKKEQNKGAVQEPNAFLERHLLKSSYALFDILKEKGLLDQVGFKDLGAGGVACASVEIAEAAGYGADVYTDQIHVGMEGLDPAVILCSETQERFMWCCHPDVTPMILEHYNEVYALPKVSVGAKASVVGKIRDDGLYRVHQGNELLVDAKASDVVKGIQVARPFEKRSVEHHEPQYDDVDIEASLKQILSHENIASKQCVYENYDKQVQGRTIIERSSADAGVMAPFNESRFPEEVRETGIALSLAQQPLICSVDAYWGTVNALALSIMRVAAVGAEPLALTDCLCFGSPEKPEHMADFVDAVKALAEFSEHVPVVAGNVSFYNESKTQSVPPSPMLSCLGRMDDAKKAVTKHLKKADSVLFYVGHLNEDCGGSHYYSIIHGTLGVNLPKPDLKEALMASSAVARCIERSYLLSSRVVSDGGLLVALATMMFKYQIGVELQLDTELSLDKVLFNETPAFILEVEKEHEQDVITCLDLNKVHYEKIGFTKNESVITIGGINISGQELCSLWTKGLREKLL